MADESSTKLEIDFHLTPCDNVDTSGRTTLSYGSVWFNNGDAFVRAAMWQGVLLHEFLRKAIEDYLWEVQSAMEEADVATPD